MGIAEPVVDDAPSYRGLYRECPEKPWNYP